MGQCNHNQQRMKTPYPPKPETVIMSSDDEIERLNSLLADTRHEAGLCHAELKDCLILCQGDLKERMRLASLLMRLGKVAYPAKKGSL